MAGLFNQSLVPSCQHDEFRQRHAQLSTPSMPSTSSTTKPTTSTTYEDTNLDASFGPGNYCLCRAHQCDVAGDNQAADAEYHTFSPSTSFHTAKPGKGLSAHSQTHSYNQMFDGLAQQSIHSNLIDLDCIFTDYEASDSSENSASIHSVRTPDDGWWNTQLEFAGIDNHTAFPLPCTLEHDPIPSGADHCAVYEAGGGEHTGNTPVCWDHGCNGRVFSSWSNLRRHQREKQGKSPKSHCPLCGAFFSRTTARNQHLANMSCGRIRRYSNGRDRPSFLKMQQANSQTCLAVDEDISSVPWFG